MSSNFGRSLRVALLAGGASAEREISLASGAAVRAALECAGHRVVSIDTASQCLADLDWSGVDVCFIALHGGAGEDGRVQQQLEDLGIPYTGSGPQASRLAMSKSASKERFRQTGVPTAPCVTFRADQTFDEIAARVAALGYPVVVKPDNQGSSLGVSIVHSAAELPTLLGEVFRFDTLGLAEPLIQGREFTVAVLERRALAPLEIVTREVFSFELKYQCQGAEHRPAADLMAKETNLLKQVAVAAAVALGTTGLVRVDLMRDRSGQPWVLEVNTVPGMTARSLAPAAAAQAGLDLTRLCELLIHEPRTPVCASLNLVGLS